jgi:circadian clock protein KaiC
MLNGKGFYKGSSILVSGSSGTGKTNIATHFAAASCERGERCLFFAFEESETQIVRNSKSINLDLAKYIKDGLLVFHSSHPSEHGLEQHLVTVSNLLRQYRPKVLIIDPITNLISVGALYDVKSMLMRLIDIVQAQGVTLLFTALSTNHSYEQTDDAISSLLDAWIQLRNVEVDDQRNRALFIMKSRGMAHSNEVREFVISNKGIEIRELESATAKGLRILDKKAQKLPSGKR